MQLVNLAWVMLDETFEGFLTCMKTNARPRSILPFDEDLLSSLTRRQPEEKASILSCKLILAQVF